MWSGASGQEGRLIMHTGSGDDEAHDFFDNYRFMALRGPLVVHGWGYDLHGKPIPNKSGDAPNSFTTSYTSLKDEFATNWLEDATTWPVAPVDLRFDRKRGVWTVPSAFRLYQVEVSGELLAGQSAPATVIRYKDDILNADGSKVSNPQVMLSNWTSANISSGTKAMAYYDTAECAYWVVGGGVASGGGSGITTGIDVVTHVCCSGSNFAIARKRLCFIDGLLTAPTESGCSGVPEDMECSGLLS